MFEIYTQNIKDFDSVKTQLMEMERKLQLDRNVPHWKTMFELINDSHSAALFVTAFLDRQTTDEDNHDHDDGTYITSPLPSQAKNSSPKGSASKISI